jgi:multidrug efflux system membrane fusion protein
MRRQPVFPLVSALLAAAVGGCQGEKPKVAPPEAPAVPISQAVRREITDYVDFTGRTDAVHAVDIRPRVTGYLTKAPFKEGAEVKKDDLLFEIDPRPYEAQLEQAESQVALNEASLKLARTTLERDRQVNLTVRGGVSQQQLDQDRAAVDEALARVTASKASTVVYKLNLSYCTVTSPIDGQISRKYLHTGNLVNQDSTLLTTIVSLDPMWAYFDMDEPTLLRIRRAVNDGKIKPAADGTFPVFMGLQGEEGFPHQGKIDFVNNQVNPTTGSISVRGIFPNPLPVKNPATLAANSFAFVSQSLLRQAGGGGLAPYFLGVAETVAREKGVRLLSPGMFVRIRFPIGDPYDALLVIDRAIQSDQGLKYVYVVDKENQVQYRAVTTGSLQSDGLRVITRGLKPGDWVVVGGLQMVRPKTTIRPDKVPMPSLTQASTEDSRQ